MFPVGLISPYGVSSPIVSSKTGEIIGFLGPGSGKFNKQNKRLFYRVDMAGFAFSLKLLNLKHPIMKYQATMEEESFLRDMDIRLKLCQQNFNNILADLYTYKALFFLVILNSMINLFNL